MNGARYNVDIAEIAWQMRGFDHLTAGFQHTRLRPFIWRRGEVARAILHCTHRIILRLGGRADRTKATIRLGEAISCCWRGC